MTSSMTPAMTAAAMYGLATNEAIPLEDRLQAALQSLKYYSERPSTEVFASVPEDAPPAWKTLLAALALLCKGQSNDISPVHCGHDELTVCADPAKFSDTELLALYEMGFVPGDNGTFSSYRYGSA